MSKIENIQILRPNENFEALYINGECVMEAHSIDVGDAMACVLQALGLPDESLDILTYEDVDEDDESVDSDGNVSFYDAVVWTNGEGCPATWPFEIKAEQAESKGKE